MAHREQLVYLGVSESTWIAQGIRNTRWVEQVLVVRLQALVSTGISVYRQVVRSVLT